jgi:hypothetical protein
MAHIFNKFGVMHTIPDDMPLPPGARKATKDEITAWKAADAKAKAGILAAKQATAARRAQLVVVSAPAAEPSSPSAFSKTPGDNKPKGPKHDESPA